MTATSEFMRRDQVPEGHEWQTRDGDTWYGANAHPTLGERWVRVRPVAQPERWAVREGDIDNGHGLYLRLYAYDAGAVENVIDNRLQRIADLLNGEGSVS